MFEDRYTTAFVHNAQMEPRSCVAHWEGEKLTVYTPTGGISNCRHDMARDLGMPDENVRVVCQYMGGNFGNKNQNQDADLIAAVLAREAGAPVKLELSRQEDWIGMHGRWPTVQYYKVGVIDDGRLNADSAARLQRHGSVSQERRRNRRHGAVRLPEYRKRHCIPSTPTAPSRRTSAAPSHPQGVFGIASMMDDIAYKLKMDPVEFALKNMTRDTGQYTNHTLEECIRRARRRSSGRSAGSRMPGSQPRSDQARDRDVLCGVSLRRRKRQRHHHARSRSGRYTFFVGVTDVGGGAKTTMGMIAAEELGVPLSKVDVVWGDTDRCPYSVGESGSRTTCFTGVSVIEAARDLKRQLAAKGAPSGDQVLIASSVTDQDTKGKIRNCWGAHFCEVDVDIERGRVHVRKYVAVHESGRIMNPVTARDQFRGGVLHGIGQALHEDMVYDRRTGQSANDWLLLRAPSHTSRRAARRGHLHRNG